MVLQEVRKRPTAVEMWDTCAVCGGALNYDVLCHTCRLPYCTVCGLCLGQAIGECEG